MDVCSDVVTIDKWLLFSDTKYEYTGWVGDYQTANEEQNLYEHIERPVVRHNFSRQQCR